MLLTNGLTFTSYLSMTQRACAALFRYVTHAHIGWERISDAHYGVYYIGTLRNVTKLLRRSSVARELRNVLVGSLDHINKRTQYERPYELELTKGTQGFGFTLIELDRGLVVVKSIIPGGPAFVSGVIQPGDVLVSVSGVSVSGLQHSDIARLFATFVVGDRVKLTFARGYQLPPELAADDDEYEFHAVTITKGTSGFGFTIVSDFSTSGYININYHLCYRQTVRRKCGSKGQEDSGRRAMWQFATRRSAGQRERH